MKRAPLAPRAGPASLEHARRVLAIEAEAIRALAERFHLKRWALLGNDYVWPRLSHALACRYIRESGGAVIDDTVGAGASVMLASAVPCFRDDA